MPQEPGKNTLATRFRGFLPVIIDVETGGFNSQTDALLEIAAVIVRMDKNGFLRLGETCAYHIEPFPGANLDQAALDYNKIKPYHPFRYAIPEPDAVARLFKVVRKYTKENKCSRAILVGHNPFFDLGFLKAAVDRNGIKKSPFHAFSTFDTATLGGLAFGQTVLSRAAQAAGLEWDEREAHSAVYDAERTAQLFCIIVNRWKSLTIGLA